jgi:hypothetical protein
MWLAPRLRLKDCTDKSCGAASMRRHDSSRMAGLTPARSRRRPVRWPAGRAGSLSFKRHGVTPLTDGSKSNAASGVTLARCDTGGSQLRRRTLGRHPIELALPPSPAGVPRPNCFSKWENIATEDHLRFLMSETDFRHTGYIFCSRRSRGVIGWGRAVTKVQC